MSLYSLRTGVSLSTHAAAKWTRNQLAEALRQSPYQVNVLLAGWDASVGPSMYYMDYLGSLHPMKIAAHGYPSYFAFSILDRYWKADMGVGDAVALLKRCIDELKQRFVLNVSEFKMKIVDKDGIRDLTADPPPPPIEGLKLHGHSSAPEPAAMGPKDGPNVTSMEE